MANDTAALYIRVSSEEQVEGYSIDAQLDALREYCRFRRITVLKEYVDAGRSAKSIEGRPALQELLHDAAQGRFQIVMVWKLNRLARNLKDLLHMLKVFNKHNVSIQSLTEDIQTDTAMGNFLVQMLGAAAELERAQICENVQLTVQNRNQQGKWNSGNMVLGYRWHKNPKQGQPQLEIVKEEAQLVRTIFEMYAGGLGLKAITNRLNAEGFKTKKGLTFCIAAVRGILANPNYIGKIRIGTSLKRTGADIEVQLVEGEQEPIIPQELWDKVQSRFGERKRSSDRTPDRAMPLTGLLKCPQCGSGMVTGRSKGYRKDGTFRLNHYYVCSSYNNRGFIACRQNAVRADDMENWFFRHVRKLVTDTGLLEHVVAAVNSKRNTDRKPLEDERRRLEKEMASFDHRQQRCFELFEDGHIDRKSFVERLNELKEQKAVLQAELKEIEEKLSDPLTESVDAERIRSALLQFRKLLQTAPIKQQRRLLRGLFDKITLPPDRNIQNAVIHCSTALQHLQLPDMGEETWKTNNKLA
ncbi:recombinase family protein [Paenibacillus thalictri]|uniref:Recombinase family protein n=1 Tax=Paenibacillus thalictri TaxID=2527873 RepID=A0A4Q9DR77_9BACL|nr:recombinase family protein [Paenibacillus thalictri]TBL77414.1 recombinase family protein [Paenibacillus thalictri]